MARLAGMENGISQGRLALLTILDPMAKESADSRHAWIEDLRRGERELAREAGALQPSSESEFFAPLLDLVDACEAWRESYRTNQATLATTHRARLPGARRAARGPGGRGGPPRSRACAVDRPAPRFARRGARSEHETDRGGAQRGLAFAVRRARDRRPGAVVRAAPVRRDGRPARGHPREPRGGVVAPAPARLPGRRGQPRTRRQRARTDPGVAPRPRCRVRRPRRAVRREQTAGWCSSRSAASSRSSSTISSSGSSRCAPR
jgi:hypothetical protein